jgi:dTDP-3-amino-3,4,6-trideoxy-alpha-D-glucose transaminase
VKLQRLDAWNTGRCRAAACYDAALAGLPVERVKCAAGACSNHHLAVVRAPHRNALRHKLAMEGIATGIHYPVPCHRQPAFASDDALTFRWWKIQQIISYRCRCRRTSARPQSGA